MTHESILFSLTLEQKVAQLSCVFLRGLTEFRQFTETKARAQVANGIDQTLNVEAGRYEVMVGSSAADIHAKQFFTFISERLVARRTVFGTKTEIVVMSN